MHTPTDSTIEELATQLSTLENPKAAVERAIESERARLDAEANRIARERAKLEAKAIEQRAREIAAENAQARALDKADAAAFEEASARAVAAVGEAAQEFVQRLLALYELRSPNGSRQMQPTEIGTILTSVGPFVDRACQNSRFGAWMPSTVFLQAGEQRYGAVDRVVAAAIARVAELDAKKTGGAP